MFYAFELLRQIAHGTARWDKGGWKINSQPVIMVRGQWTRCMGSLSILLENGLVDRNSQSLVDGFGYTVTDLGYQVLAGYPCLAANIPDGARGWGMQ